MKLIHFIDKKYGTECVVICDDKRLDETVEEYSDMKVNYVGELTCERGDASTLPTDRELSQP